MYYIFLSLNINLENCQATYIGKNMVEPYEVATT